MVKNKNFYIDFQKSEKEIKTPGYLNNMHICTFMCGLTVELRGG